MQNKIVKAIHFTVSESGGAGIAARRGVAALKTAGVDCELVSLKSIGIGSAMQRWLSRFDRLPMRLYHRRRLFTAWSNAWLAWRFADRINQFKADIVHLHWLGDGALAWSDFEQINAPVVWTLHDAWAFTGGCHYPGTCSRFEADCGRCPQLGSTVDFDLSRYNLIGRRRALDSVRCFVTPSAWLARVAMRSGRMKSSRLRVVQNTLDLTLLNHSQRAVARARRGIREGALVIAVGSLDLEELRKGNHLVSACLREWRRLTPTLPARLLVFGASVIPDLAVEGLTVESAGFLGREQDVAELLAAADVFLMPSLQDNLPNVALEAQACGCPVVGFDSGGLSEIIEPGVTGWIATEMTAEALGRTLAEYTSGPLRRRDELAEACRQNAVAKFSPEQHAAAMRAIYAEVLGQHHGVQFEA